MAAPTTSNSFLVKLGDGASPEVFSHPCGINAQSVTLTNNTGEQAVLDCADPLGAISGIDRWTETQDTQLSFSGMMSTEAFDTWRAWIDGGTEKNIRIEAFNTTALSGGYWTLPAILQSLELGRENKGKVTVTATIVGAGARTWTDAT